MNYIAKTTFSILITACCCIWCSLYAAPKSSPKKSPKPKVVFVVAFDQMRGDYPALWGKTWGDKGFNRLIKEGAWFPNCYFNHASNITAPGHAVHLTGCYPHKTGIVSNDYYDRNAGLELYCVQDTMRKTFGMTDPKEWHSPTNLKVPTLGTYLKKISPKSKVLGVSQKDRAAILMSGHDADAAFWFEHEAGGYTTSDYYTKALPSWLQSWNESHNMRSYAGKVWNTALTDPMITAIPDTMSFEALPGGRNVFPYTIPSADSLKQMNARFLLSPFSVEHLFSFARSVMQQYEVGKNNVTDIFCLSISATDYVGHQFGPHSRELPEMYAQVDKFFGEFIDYLDSTIGRENYVLAITSDHGVAPVPEYIKMTQGDTADAGRIRGLELIEAIDDGLQRAFPQAKAEKWVQNLEPPSVFLSPKAMDAAQKAGVKRVVLMDSLKAVMKRFAGMGAVVTADELVAKRRPKDVSQEVFDLIRNDYYAPRTGEVMFYPRRNWILGGATATHGTPHDYDRHTPLCFFGAGIKPSIHQERVSPADIAPTMAKILGITMKNIDGKALPVR